MTKILCVLTIFIAIFFVADTAFSKDIGELKKGDVLSPYMDTRGGIMKKELLKVCPEEWINNKMPRIIDNGLFPPSQYFILNGERREMSEFDMEWIQKNCDIKPQIVW